MRLLWRKVYLLLRIYTSLMDLGQGHHLALYKYICIYIIYMYINGWIYGYDMIKVDYYIIGDFHILINIIMKTNIIIRMNMMDIMKSTNGFVYICVIKVIQFYS